MGQYIPFICTCGCGSAPNSCCKKIKTSDIVYCGPPLACLNAVTDTSLNHILQKLEELCVKVNTPSTTSTTSSTSTTSTSTSTTTTTTTVANCKVFAFNAMQEQNFPPTIVVTESTFGETSYTTEYINVGQYTVTLNGPVPVMGPTTLVLTGVNTTPVYAIGIGNKIHINTFQANGTSPADEVLANVMSFYIKHCAVVPTTTTTTTSPPTTTTTTTTVAPTTTTTTTSGSFSFAMSALTGDTISCCTSSSFPNTFYANVATPTIGTIMYTNPGLTTPVLGSNGWFRRGNLNVGYQINNSGSIVSTVPC